MPQEQKISMVLCFLWDFPYFYAKMWFFFQTCPMEHPTIPQNMKLTAHWLEVLFFCCLRKVPPAQALQVYCTNFAGIIIKETISNFLQIFMLDPKFLCAHRNRYSEGTDNGQMTPRGYTLILIPTLKIYVFFLFRLDGRTDRDINPGGAG
jgi:hypothetical protein